MACQNNFADLLREKLEQAIQAAPGDRSLRSDWLGNEEALARCHFLRRDITRDDWIAKQQAILAERRDLAGQSPPSPRFQGEVAASAAVLAGLLLRAGRPAEALACVDKVLPAHEQLVRAEQEWPAKALLAAGNDSDKLEPRRGHYRLIEPVAQENSALRRQSADLLAQKAAALGHGGRGAEAVEAVRQAIALAEGLVVGDRQVRSPPASPAAVWSFFAEEIYRQEPCYLYDLACHLALASTLSAETGIPDAAGRAVQALRDYIASGFDNPHKLRTDPALDPLRKRDDFRKLVRDLEATVQGRKEPL
jgi:hypothetical protein